MKGIDDKLIKCHEGKYSCLEFLVNKAINYYATYHFNNQNSVKGWPFVPNAGVKDLFNVKVTRMS